MINRTEMAFGIIAILLGFGMITFGAVSLERSANDDTVKIVDCYDAGRNKIIGAMCEDMSDEEMASWLIIMGVLILMLGLIMSSLALYLNRYEVKN